MKVNNGSQQIIRLGTAAKIVGSIFKESIVNPTSTGMIQIKTNLTGEQEVRVVPPKQKSDTSED